MPGFEVLNVLGCGYLLCAIVSTTVEDFGLSLRVLGSSPSKGATCGCKEGNCCKSGCLAEKFFLSSSACCPSLLLSL